MQSRSNRHHDALRRPLLKVVLLVVSTLLVAGVAYGVRLYSQAKYAIDATYNDADSTDAAATFKEKKPFAILLMGVDTGALGRDYKGRTDTMIVAVVNPKLKKTQMVSIPRDTLAKMEGQRKFSMQKINAAYDIGGSKMARASVSKLINVPIKYYLTINMGALQTLVDAVGGIDVNVAFSWSDPYVGNFKFEKGPMHLKGDQALAYARMRHADPQGDYGRQQRQQEVIKAVMKKALTLDSLGNYTKILKAVSQNMQTNLTFADITTLITNYRDAAGKLTSDGLQGHDAWIYPGPSAYQVPSTEEMQRVSNKLRKSLGLKQETVKNQNTRENAANKRFDFDNPKAQTYTIYTPAT